MTFFHCHAHGEYSVMDGVGTVADMVAKAARLGQPGLALTDHGVMSGSFQLYKACKKHGILPFPGVELYTVADLEPDATRHHLTAIALTTKGYQGLVHLSTRTHLREQYHRKPRASWSDLAEFGKDYGPDIVLTTGCYFGPVQQAIVKGDLDKALELTKMLAWWFPRLHVEIQHHNTPRSGTNVVDDTTMAVHLFDIATQLGLPILATQDCHYLSHDHVELHKSMKGIVYAADPGDVAFPGDAYHLCSGDWVQSHLVDQPEIWQASSAAMDQLVADNQVSIPFLDEYRYWVPELADDPLQAVRDLCVEAFTDGRPLVTGADYNARLEEELFVIHETGFAGYFLLVHDYVQWARDRGILVRARGSAGGSLVCWLLGFTDTDPLRWELSFDRFLTPDRERPPDIDIDVEDARRDEVIQYLKDRWDVVQIGTFGKIGLDDHGGGSLLRQFLTAKRRQMDNSPDFYRRYGKVDSMEHLQRVDHESAHLLRELDDLRIRRSAGAHAAGYLIGTSEHKIADWIPTMLIASSGSYVTQMEMDDTEDAGFLKLDVLGLRSLTTLRRVYDLLGEKPDIPYDDHETFKFLRRGRTLTGIFQFEGYTAAKGLKEMKAETMDDLVVTNAIYRPATRNSGMTDEYIERRNGKAWDLPDPIFGPILNPTFGVPAYQEQVLAIAERVGMDSVERNSILKAVKVKHGKAGTSAASTKAFDDAKERFLSCCRESGVSEEGAAETWELIEGFAAYGFNKSHAVSYSLLGYELAYLKVHYPLEFHAALLETSAGSDKEADYVDETRRCGISILRPDVNVSGPLYSIDYKHRAIRRGLSSVPKVGMKAALEIANRAPYTSIEDMIERCPGRPVSGGKKWAKEKELNGVLRALQDAGAMRDLGLLPT